MKALSCVCQVSVAALLLALAPSCVWAVETEISVFGTLGYARSSSGMRYLRDIDRRGTLRQDSRLGLQADVALAPEWSATAQVQVASKPDADSGYSARLAWAFLAWRPNNDWLLRAGRFRVPLYMHSQTLDLDVASPFARAPREMYSVSPTDDFSGVYVSRTFNWSGAEWTLDGIAGSAHSTYRTWTREGIPGFFDAGASYTGVNIDIVGAAITRNTSSTILRASAFRARTDFGGRRVPASLPFVQLAPGVGFYIVDAAFGPVPTVDSVHNTVLSVGAEWKVTPAWRLSTEFFSNRQHDMDLGANLYGGYASVAYRSGAWAPYAYLARVKMREPQGSLYTALTHPTLPPTAFPGAAQLVTAQRITGDAGIFSFDQRTLALGTSWSITPRSMLKLEWSRTRVGRGSRFLDVPAGQDAGGARFSVISINYSFLY